jgi:hypothetical protein
MYKYMGSVVGFEVLTAVSIENTLPYSLVEVYRRL